MKETNEESRVGCGSSSRRHGKDRLREPLTGERNNDEGVVLWLVYTHFLLKRKVIQVRFPTFSFLLSSLRLIIGFHFSTWLSSDLTTREYNLTHHTQWDTHKRLFRNGEKTL